MKQVAVSSMVECADLEKVKTKIENWGKRDLVNFLRVFNNNINPSVMTLIDINNLNYILLLEQKVLASIRSSEEKTHLEICLSLAEGTVLLSEQLYQYCNSVPINIFQTTTPQNQILEVFQESFSLVEVFFMKADELLGATESHLFLSEYAIKSNEYRYLTTSIEKYKVKDIQYYLYNLIAVCGAGEKYPDAQDRALLIKQVEPYVIDLVRNYTPENFEEFLLKMENDSVLAEGLFHLNSIFYVLYFSDVLGLDEQPLNEVKDYYSREFAELCIAMYRRFDEVAGEATTHAFNNILIDPK